MVHVVFWPYYARCAERVDFLEKAFPRDTCNWVDKFAEFRAYEDGAVVVINGGGCYEQDLQGMHEMQEELKPFRWVLLVSMNDEGSGQRLEWIDHPHCSIWVQDPKPGRHDNFHRLPSWPICGYEKVLSGFQNEMSNRILDWFFSGSVRDVAWIEAIKTLPGNGKFFGSHLGYEGYMHHLASAKFTPCRPCFSSPETCRLYDALEAGSIPIVGLYPAINPTSGVPWWPSYGYDWPHYWEYMFGERPPFIIIESAADLNWAFQEALNNWTPEQNVKVRNWWLGYKERFIASLQLEVQRLQNASSA